MDLLHNLSIGFGVALTFTNLAYAFFGCVLGTLIGVLPGLGPVATIAMLLPSIYSLDATPALIMLAGIYYGAQYGGSTTAILINVPGESSSVSGGAKAARMMVPTQPAKKEPRPAVASAAPARPWRAIW